MFSKTNIAGHATKDAEYWPAVNGHAARTTFTLATSEKIKGRNGEEVKLTEHRIVCWGPLAETAAQCVREGVLVFVRGIIDHVKYEKDGVTINKTEMVADKISLDSFQVTTLIGNAGKDAEVRYTASGTPVSTFTLATSRKTKGENGEWKDKTTWHNIVCRGKTADIAAEFVCKGKLVAVEGSLSYSSYEKNGVTHNKTELTADTLRFLGGGAKRD